MGGAEREEAIAKVLEELRLATAAVEEMLRPVEIELLGELEYDELSRRHDRINKLWQRYVRLRDT